LDVLYELTRPNALFLSVAAQSEAELVMPVYNWFRASLSFPVPWVRDTGQAVAERILDHLRGDLQRKQILVDLLATADVGISDFQIVQVDDPSSLVWPLLRPTDDSMSLLKKRLANPKFVVDVDRAALLFRHGQAEALFDFRDESAGTRSWLSLLPDALDALEVGGTMVIDEIDASLHPLLTARLIGLFREADTNPRGAQLIFTTHDASLLGTALGEEVLARDQIWFVEKDRNGASRLYPLSDFKPREGENRERRYLGGSYGAVPVVSSTGFADAVREG
jgi:hypothetical protein